MKKVLLSLTGLFLTMGSLFSQVDSISNIRISQRTDGSKIVDIYYDLTGPEYYYNIDLEVSFDNGNTYVPTDSLYGDWGIGVQPGNDKHVIWYAGKEIPNQYNDSVLVKILSSTEYFTCGITKFFHEGFEYGSVRHEKRCWLDRNLGAIRVMDTIIDSLSFGDAYQWGRLKDGHQIVTSETTSIKSTGDIPGHGMFILGSGDWRATPNDNLWQGANGLNNPCPANFRVPTKSEWEVAVVNFDQMIETLKIPWSGYRDASTGEYHYSTTFGGGAVVPTGQAL